MLPFRFKLDELLERLVIAAFVIHLALFLVDAAFVISYPYQIDYGEGFLLNQARIFSERRWIYKDVNEPPFLVSNYPPIYPLLVSLFTSVFGLSFLWGRIISFASTCLVALLIYKLVTSKAGRKIGTISALIFLSSPFVAHWGVLHRVDALALLFAFAGIYFFQRGGNRGIYFSVPFFVASIFTKQSFLAAPLTAFICLILRREIGLAFKFSVIMLSSCLVPFYAINSFTSGQLFLHIVIYNINTFSLYQAARFFEYFLRLHGPLEMLAAWFLFTALRSRAFGNFFLIYFIISHSLSITVGKVGAYINYFLEPIAVGCLLLGAAVKELTKHTNEGRGTQRLVWLALLILALSFARTPLAYRLIGGLECGKIISMRVQSYERILSEDGGILVINGKEVLFQPFELTQLCIQGLWDEMKIVSEIENKKIDLIILEFNAFDPPTTERFTPRMLQAIQSNYCLIEKIGGKYLYVPRLDT